MAKMKYWDGTKWVMLDAADADTVEGKTVAQIQSGTTKQDVGLGNVDNVKQASKAEFNTHLADGASHSKPARFVVGTSISGWTEKQYYILLS